jgi:DUF917 family protein
MSTNVVWLIGGLSDATPGLGPGSCRAWRPGATLADDAAVAVVSTMGAPLVMQERVVDPGPMVESIRAMEAYLGRPFDAVMAVEIGGSNALQPCQIGAVTGLPVVDGDAMGRAFPEAQMTSFAIHDLPMAPLTLVDVRDNAVIVARAASWKWMERLSRKACVEVGSIAATCKAPRTGREVKECGILYTVSKAIRIGETVQAAQAAHRDAIQAVIDAEGGRLIFRGKIRDVERRTTEGFLRGTATLDGLDGDRGRSFRLAFPVGRRAHEAPTRRGWPRGPVMKASPADICASSSRNGRVSEGPGRKPLRAR